jgi:hypothetical protein
MHSASDHTVFMGFSSRCSNFAISHTTNSAAEREIGRTDFLQYAGTLAVARMSDRRLRSAVSIYK